VDLRGVAAGGGDRVGQPLLAVALARPDQAVEPADIVVVGDVERVEVDPGPPRGTGRPGRGAHPLGPGRGQRGLGRVLPELWARIGNVAGVLAQQLLLAQLAVTEGRAPAGMAIAREVSRWAGALGLTLCQKQAEALLASRG
jgi:hypothetical protein